MADESGEIRYIEQRRDGPVAILVVDQQENLALMFQRALVKKGYACDVATTSHDAVTLLAKGDYSILVADVDMPLISGIRLMSKAKQANADMRVILVSEAASIERAVQAIREGANDFLAKPFEIDVLYSKVRKLAKEVMSYSSEGSDSFFGRAPGSLRRPNLPGYRMDKRLGGGSMGIVFLAHHRTLNREVAVKVIDPAAFSDGDAVSLFTLEARTAARLNHPNIIQVYDLVEKDGFLFLVMEYFPSKPLSTVVEKVGQLPWKRAVWVGIQITRALIHSSAQNIVHRDVKPGNILIGKSWAAKLADFGLAKERAVVGASESEDDILKDGVIVGTPAYISPEQVHARPDIDVRSDVYNLGLCMYFMLEGRDPYSGNVVQVLQSQVHAPLPDFQNAVPPKIQAIVRKMTAKDPAARFQNGGELLSALRAVSLSR